MDDLFRDMAMKMSQMKQDLAERQVEATSGGGMVTVVATGEQRIASIKIERDVVDPEDVEMLEDLVLAAVNEALRKAQEMASGELQRLAGGLNLPGLS